MIHSTRDRRRQATQDELLDVALEVVAEDGLDGLTVARLADGMGWTKGAMYRYFPGKDHLIAALNARVLAEWTEVADAALQATELPDRDALGRVLLLVDTWIGLALDRPAQFGLIAVTLADPRMLVERIEDAAHLPALLGLLQRVGGLLQEAADQGTLAPGDPLGRALQLVFAVQGVLQLRKLARFASVAGPAPLFDTRTLGARTARDLLAAWAPLEAP